MRDGGIDLGYSIFISLHVVIKGGECRLGRQALSQILKETSN